MLVDARQPTVLPCVEINNKYLSVLFCKIFPYKIILLVIPIHYSVILLASLFCYYVYT